MGVEVGVSVEKGKCGGELPPSSLTTPIPACLTSIGAVNGLG